MFVVVAGGRVPGGRGTQRNGRPVLVTGGRTAASSLAAFDASGPDGIVRLVGTEGG